MSDSPKKTGLGLGRMGNLSQLLNNTNDGLAVNNMIPIDKIREDPNNPRKNFDKERLRELADSIEQAGVVQPISVRPDPDNAGKYIINQGHRRFRATKMAGKKEIFAVVVEDTDEEQIRTNQLIENFQREDLTVIDAVNALGELVNKGLSPKEIGKKISKSAAFISQHLRVLEASLIIKKALENGKIGDVTTAYELVKFEKEHPDIVADFVKDMPQITRRDVARLKNTESSPISSAHEPETPAAGMVSKLSDKPSLDVTEPPADSQHQTEEITPAQPDVLDEKPAKKKRAGMPVFTVYRIPKGGTANRKSFEATIITNKPAKSDKHVWIRYVASGRGEEEVPIKSLEFHKITFPGASDDAMM